MFFSAGIWDSSDQSVDSFKGWGSVFHFRQKGLARDIFLVSLQKSPLGFRLDIRRNFFPEKRDPREVVEWPSLEGIPKTRWMWPFTPQVCGDAGIWAKAGLGDFVHFSNLNYLTIRWFHFLSHNSILQNILQIHSLSKNIKFSGKSPKSHAGIDPTLLQPPAPVQLHWSNLIDDTNYQ